MRIIQAESKLTGGNVETYWGLLDDGQYFVFSSLGIFSFCDSDYGYVMTEKFYEETGGDTYNWMKKHCIETFDKSKNQFSVRIQKIIELTFEKIRSTK